MDARLNDSDNEAPAANSPTVTPLLVLPADASEWRSPDATPPKRRGRSLLRSGACVTLALCVHVAGAAALMLHWDNAADALASGPVITVDLAATSAAPTLTPSPTPPGPPQAAAQETAPAKPAEAPPLPPAAQAEIVTAALPPEKPAVAPHEDKHVAHAHAARAPASAERQAKHAVALAPGAGAHNSSAAPNWKSMLVAALERSKRYPAEAAARGDHGVAELAFSIDRHGGVHHARIARSSGSGLLDRETLAMVARAAPLPPPPPDMAGAQIPVVVPIHYDIR